ncbi:MAG: hypothetical protein ACI3XR_02710 [Eubacteriales bacterium]
MRKPIQFLTVLMAGLLLAATLISCKEETPDNPSDKDKSENKTTSFAEEVVKTPIDDFEWEAGEGGITITAYKGNAEKVVIPSIIENKKVISIAANVFSGSITLKEIVLSDYMELDFKWFANCENLSVISAPGATSIPKYVTEDLGFSLSRLDLSGVTSISADYCHTNSKPVHVEVLDLSGLTSYSGGVGWNTEFELAIHAETIILSDTFLIDELGYIEDHHLDIEIYGSDIHDWIYNFHCTQIMVGDTVYTKES